MNESENSPNPGQTLVQSFKFKEHSVTWLEWRGVQVWIAREVGRAQGYADDGKRLIKNITQRWSVSKDGGTPRFRLGDESEVGQKQMDGFHLEGESLALLKSVLRDSTRGQIGPSSDSTRGQIGPSSDLGRINSLLLLTESGLYNVMGAAQTQQAIEFRHWVNSEVLPSLSKTGTYALGGSKPKHVEDKQHTEEALRNMKERRLLRTLRDRTVSRVFNAIKLKGIERDRALRVTLMGAKGILNAQEFEQLEYFARPFFVNGSEDLPSQAPLDFDYPQQLLMNVSQLPVPFQRVFAELSSLMDNVVNAPPTIDTGAEE